MDVTALNNSTVTQSGTAGAATKTVSKDEFLHLFVTQLRYQNPLNPMDSSQFTAQLAQFSSLEQLTNISNQMDMMLLYQKSLQNTLTSSLIGKKVNISDDTVTLKGKADISYSLAQDAAKVTISLYDAGGKLVREIQVGQQKAGQENYTWDGRDLNGNVLPDGAYTAKVAAFDASGNPVAVTSTANGTVTGIVYENNITYLVIDGKTKVQLSSVNEISGGGA